MKQRSSFRRIAVAQIVASALFSIAGIELAAAGEFIQVVKGLNETAGIAYHESASASEQFLVVSVNELTPNAPKFRRINPDRTVSDFGFYTDTGAAVDLPLNFEPKLASIRNIRGQTVPAGGFVRGDLFCGTGYDGEIMRIWNTSPNGAVQRDAIRNKPLPFARISGSHGAVRAITHDRDGVLGGNLFVATEDGMIWTINSAGAVVGGGIAVKDGKGIEAILVVPNDPYRYGALAGTLLVGQDETYFNLGLVQTGHWTVNTRTLQVQRLYSNSSGQITTTPTSQPLWAEDLDLFDANERAYTLSYYDNSLFADSSENSYFRGARDGDILITQENAANGTGRMYVVTANLGTLTVSDAGVPWATYEHTCFAPAPLPVLSIQSVAPTNAVSTSEGSGIPATFTLHSDQSGIQAQVNAKLKISGSATYGVDYSVWIGDAMVTVGPDKAFTVATSVTNHDKVISVYAYEDSQQESVESIVLTIVPDPTYIAQATPFNQATVSILSNDLIPMPTGWKLYDLGTLGGNQSQAFGIGSTLAGGSVHVVGTSQTSLSSTNSHAFDALVTPTATSVGGTMRRIHPTATWSSATAIDKDSGIVVGQFFDPAYVTPQAFSWNPAEVTGIFNGIYPYTSLQADGIATAVATVPGYGLKVVGTSKQFGTFRGTSWYQSTDPVDLGAIAASQPIYSSFVSGVNRKGTYVGRSITSRGSIHAFRTPITHGIFPADDLLAPIGADVSEATAINDYDETVGNSGTYYPVMWLGHGAANAAYNRLWIPTSNGVDYGGVHSINNNGISVGWRQSGVLGRKVAIVWWNNGAYSYDLQSVETGPSALPNVTVVGGGSWILHATTGINDSQWMVGYGIRNGGQVHAFLLKPN
jgi:hypothetical protein